MARCESSLNPAAIGGSSYGLFQIHSIHAYRFPDFWARWMEPEYNTEMAYTLWSEQGWAPWSCAP